MPPSPAPSTPCVCGPKQTPTHWPASQPVPAPSQPFARQRLLKTKGFTLWCLAAQRRCSMLDALGACAALSLALWLFACLLIRPLTPFFRHPLLHPAYPQLVTSRGCLDKRQAAEGFTNSALRVPPLLAWECPVLPPSPTTLLCHPPLCATSHFASQDALR